MEDKFFDTVKSRFNYHSFRILSDVEYLEYIASDYYAKLDPGFIAAMDKIKELIKEAETYIDAMETTNV